MKNINKIFIIILFIISSCGGNGKVKEIANFKMTIIVDKQIPAQLNDDASLKNLFLCIESANCLNNVFLPQITLLRIDLEKIYSQKFDIEVSQKRKAPDALNRLIDKTIAEIKINKKLKSDEINDSKIKINNLLSFLSENSNIEIISFNKNPDIKTCNIEGSKSYNNISEIDSLRNYIVSKLCKEGDDENYKAVEGKEFILLYNLKLGSESFIIDKPLPNDDSIKLVSLLNKADKAFNSKQYKSAKTFYSEALIIKSGDIFIIERIKVIEKLLTEGPQRPPKNTLKKTFPNHDYYIGDMVDGLMDGAGEYHYAIKQPINPKFPSKGYAEAGDVLYGAWKKGYVTSGVLHDNKGNVKDRIVIGSVEQ